MKNINKCKMDSVAYAVMLCIRKRFRFRN